MEWDWIRETGNLPMKGRPSIFFVKKVYSGGESYLTVYVACSKEHRVLNGVTAVVA